MNKQNAKPHHITLVVSQEESTKTQCNNYVPNSRNCYNMLLPIAPNFKIRSGTIFTNYSLCNESRRTKSRNTIEVLLEESQEESKRPQSNNFISNSRNCSNVAYLVVPNFEISVNRQYFH